MNELTIVKREMYKVNIKSFDYHDRMVKDGLSSAKTGMKQAFEHLRVIKGEQMYKKIDSNWESFLNNHYGKGFSLTAYRKMETFINVIEKYSVADRDLLPNLAQMDALSTSSTSKAIEEWDGVVEKAKVFDKDPATLTNQEVRELKSQVKQEESPPKPMVDRKDVLPTIDDLMFKANNKSVALINVLRDLHSIKDSGVVPGLAIREVLVGNLNEVVHLVNLFKDAEE